MSSNRIFPIPMNTGGGLNPDNYYTKDEINEMLQGVDSIQGYQGYQGVAGQNGQDGAQGTMGLQGIAGEQGTTGAQGVQGIMGIQGSFPSNTTVELQFVLEDNSMVNYEMFIRQ